MKINLKKSDCTFYVNEKKRAVTCVLPCDQYMLLYYVNDFHIFAADKERNALMMPTYVTAVAYCAPDDEWDEEIGKLAAFTKAKKHAVKLMFACMNKFFALHDKRYDTLFDSFNKLGERWSERINKNRQLLHEAAKK